MQTIGIMLKIHGKKLSIEYSILQMSEENYFIIKKKKSIGMNSGK